MYGLQGGSGQVKQTHACSEEEEAEEEEGERAAEADSGLMEVGFTSMASVLKTS